MRAEARQMLGAEGDTPHYPAEKEGSCDVSTDVESSHDSEEISGVLGEGAPAGDEDAAMDQNADLDMNQDVDMDEIFSALGPA